MRLAIEEQREINGKILLGNGDGCPRAAYSQDVCHVVEQLINLIDTQPALMGDDKSGENKYMSRDRHKMIMLYRKRFLRVQPLCGKFDDDHQIKYAKEDEHITCLRCFDDMEHGEELKRDLMRKRNAC